MNKITANTNDDNSIENLDSRYEKSLELQRELEKVEVTAVKLKEKYKEYQELSSFIDYLKGTEQVFITARMKLWSGERLKKELVGVEMNLMSLSSGLDEDVFSTIRDDFQLTYTSISQIHSVSQKLLDNHKDCAGCKDFIIYLRDLSIIFYDSKENNESPDEIKEKVFKARMNVLSTDSDTDLKTLEEIYNEFRDKLKL
ncbi:hypothetical protein BMS3Abin15_01211 [bacterium BMS3Abin15]|nr:hypothetical protein BMS3Abin15_01211 [bacterium BMS3Abin15]HDZ85872.1 hypothetical protein [Candidatus Moranbacteria bacterium]